MRLTILVVDDQREDRKVIADLLTQEPALTEQALRVVEAQDGVEGLEIFCRERPDLVLLDLLLPRADGFSLCHNIRELTHGKNVPLLAVSGVYNDAAVAKQLMDNFHAELLPKPIQPRRLVAKVIELVRQIRPLAMRRVAAPDLMDTTGPFLPEEDTLEHATPAPELMFAVPSPVNLTRQLRTSLDKHPLGWLLVQCAAAEVTGSLRLIRGKVRRVIYLVKGNPVYVDSNLRNEALGHYLVTKRVLTEEQLADAMKQARAGHDKLGEVLVRMGMISESVVRESLLGQVRLKLVNALRSSDGTVSFVPGDDFSDQVPQSPVDSVELVLIVLKKLASSPDLRSGWEPYLRYAVRLTSLGEHFKFNIERVFGTRTLSKLLTAAALRQVLSSQQDEAALLVLLESLRLTGLIEFVEAAPAAIEFEVDSALDSALAVDFHDLDPTLRRNQSGVIHLEELELLDPGEQPPHSTPDSTDEGDVQAIEGIELESSASSVLPVAPLQPLAAKPVAQVAALPSENARADQQGEAALRQALLTACQDLQHTSFYQVLGVEPDASAAQVEEAYRQTLRRYAPACFVGVASPVEMERVKEFAAIAEQAHAVLADPLRRRNYDETLALSQVQTQTDPDAFGAELLFQDGEARLRDSDFDGAVRALEGAVRANPAQADYRASLGWALFLARGRGEVGAMVARPHLDEALRIAPDSASAHEIMAHVALEVRAYTEAAEHFGRALQSGTPRMDLFCKLKDVLLRLARYSELEQQCRNFIFRLRDCDPLGTVPVWLELARLYIDRLDQPENARVALNVAAKVAAKLAPHDEAMRQAIQALQSAAFASKPEQLVKTSQPALSGDWRDQARLCRRRFLAAPNEAAALRELVKLHLDGGRAELACDALALRAALGSATPQEEQLLRDISPPGLRRASRPLSPAELALLEGGDPPSALLGALNALAPILGRLAPINLEALGSSEQDGVSAVALPQPFAGVLAYVSAQLRVPRPVIHVSGTLGNRALPFACRGSTLVVGRAVLESQDQRGMAAVLAGAISCIDAARCTLLSRSLDELKDIVVAGLSMLNPAMKPAAGSRAALWSEALQAPAWQEGLLDPLRQLMAFRSINIALARRATKRWSCRVAFLISNDVRASMALIQGEPDLGLELAEFVLGDECEQMRRALGLLP